MHYEVRVTLIKHVVVEAGSEGEAEHIAVQAMYISMPFQIQWIRPEVLVSWPSSEAREAME